MADPTTPQGADSSAAFRAFVSFGMAWRSILHSMPKPESMTGLHGPQLHLLLHLAHGPARSMSELAELAGTSSANLTGLIDRLEERGLIERVRSETDRRVVLVRLTEKGGAEHDAMEAAFRERVSQIVSALSDDEQREFARLTDKMFAAAGLDPMAGVDKTHAHAWRRGAQR